MKTYLVGGAVRDKLLNLMHTEKDYVVVGSTPEEMVQLGYKPVGKDFPVFLHPQTHEEYALARTERKKSLGYKGFEFYTSPNITLEEDLKRRDLTINAMAMDENNNIIDYYNGQKDLSQKILRHVSEAFIEDPVRILRVARFMARFFYLGFKIAPETLTLMQTMVQKGEVDALVPDRVWQEMDRALSEKNPEQFFEVLKQCGALEKLFPEIKIINIIQYFDKSIRFASLMLSIDIQQFCKHYPVPVEYREIAIAAQKIQNYFHAKTLSPEEILSILENTDAFRRENRFYLLLNFFDNPQILKKSYELIKNIDINDLTQKGLSGKNLGDAIREKRLALLRG